MTTKWTEYLTAVLPNTNIVSALPTVVDSIDTSLYLQEYITDSNDEMMTQTKTNPYWERWPKLRKCRFLLGMADGVCATIGSKCTIPQRISVTMGTSAAMRICLYLPIVNTTTTANTRFCVPHGLFCYRITKSHVIVGGALTDGGSMVDWIRSLLNLQDQCVYESCLATATTLYQQQQQQQQQQQYEEQPPQSLTVLPFLSGERSTGYRGSATGCIVGLTRQSTPSHVVLACLQGVVLRLNAIWTLLKSTVVNSNDDSNGIWVVASGNGWKHLPLWRQLLSDCLGINVVWDVDTMKEGTSRGVAILVSQALSKTTTPTLETEVLCLDLQQTATPNPSTNSLWKHLVHSQQQSIDCITPLWN